MKKTTKKLTLAKETVRELTTLPHVVGGDVTNGGCSGEVSASCDWTCACNSNVFACPITAGDSCISC
jgi:hypothetical protein